MLPVLGIQKNAQALQHLLKHPLLHCSSRPKQDTLQKYYVPKEKRVNLHLSIQIPASGTGMAVTSKPSKGHAFPEPPTDSLPVAVTM